MEKVSVRPGNLEPTLYDCDPAALYRLEQEIADLKEQGLDVSVGRTYDRAYKSPEEITRIYSYLHESDGILANYRRGLTRGSLAVRALYLVGAVLPGIRRKIDYEMDRRLEPVRTKRLFGASETDSQPWHQQRGRALALLTIASAHDLRVAGEDGGLYDTMSGPLDMSVIDYRFGDENSNLGGKSLAEALIWSEQQFSGKSFEEARRRTERRLVQTREFLEARTTRKFKDVVQYCTDSLGIRSRKEEMNQEVHDYIKKRLDNGEGVDGMTVMSFGCGTALPMLEVMQQIKEESNQCPKIILLDQDPLALASAAVLADKMGLSGNIQLECHRLFSRCGSPLDLKKVLGERKIDISEDSGLREYLPDTVYMNLTKETWKHLREGGLMVTGNMNKNRPQAEFLHGMMGWKPKVIMRSIADGFRLHGKAGVDSRNTRARVTRDGVYTLFFSTK